MTDASRFFLPCLLAFALIVPSEAQDASIRAAPTWDCTPRSKDRSHIVWKSGVGGSYAGALGMSDGRILVGSADWRFTSPAGIMSALDSSGRLLWRARHPRLKSRIHDMGQAIHSQPCFDGKRAYYMSNRGELMCVDVEGFRDGKNDGPFKGEKDEGAEDVDIVWKIDLMEELGVFKREAGDVGNPIPSPIVLGDLVFCGTAHGIDRTRGQDSADPKPPSFLAVHKLTGKIAWSSNAPGADIILGQWSSPVSARVKGADQVIFPGGDGFLYGFEPTTGKQLWKLDCNIPGVLDQHKKDSFFPDRLNGRFGFHGKPVVHEDMLYVGLNYCIEARVPLPLLAIHLDEPGGQPRIVWKFDDLAFKGTLTSAAVDGGLLFVTGADCTLFALDAKSGRECWRAKLGDDAVYFASPVVCRGRVYAAGEDTVTVFEAAREKKCLGHYEFDASYPSTPQFADGQMFIAVGEYLYALRLPE